METKLFCKRTRTLTGIPGERKKRAKPLFSAYELQWHFQSDCVYQGCARSMCWPALCFSLPLLTRSPVALLNAKIVHWKGLLWSSAHCYRVRMDFSAVKLVIYILQQDTLPLSITNLMRRVTNGDG